jgi:hypothetical protein
MLILVDAFIAFYLHFFEEFEVQMTYTVILVPPPYQIKSNVCCSSILHADLSRAHESEYDSH